jgi:hypothetical protein
MTFKRSLSWNSASTQLVLSEQMDWADEKRYDRGKSRRSKPKSDAFWYFNSSPEVIRLVVMMYVFGSR